MKKAWEPMQIQLVSWLSKFVSADHLEQQVNAKAIFGVNAERLKDLKAKYDPTNVFRRWHDVFHAEKT
jgi:Berberine and berberine like